MRNVPRASSPNGKIIAHGYLTLSLIPALVTDFVHFENLARAINFGCNKVRFYTAVPVGARVRARATVKTGTETRRRAPSSFRNQGRGKGRTQTCLRRGDARHVFL